MVWRAPGRHTKRVVCAPHQSSLSAVKPLRPAAPGGATIHAASGAISLDDTQVAAGRWERHRVGRAAHPGQAALRRHRDLTVVTCRFGSAAIWDWQNLSRSQCFLLNNLVWSAKCGEVGLDDSE